jgi:DNA helicase-2/ATP-dependent DNA helicase PcrA
MVGGTKFYSRKEIRDIVVSNVIANVRDNISLNELSMNLNVVSVLRRLKHFVILRPSKMFLLEAARDVTLSSLKGKAASELLI